MCGSNKPLLSGQFDPSLRVPEQSEGAGKARGWFVRTLGWHQPGILLDFYNDWFVKKNRCPNCPTSGEAGETSREIGERSVEVVVSVERLMVKGSEK